MDKSSLLGINLYTGRTFHANLGFTNFPPFNRRLTSCSAAFGPLIAISFLREINFTLERDVRWLQFESDNLTFEQMLSFQS